MPNVIERAETVTVNARELAAALTAVTTRMAPFAGLVAIEGDCDYATVTATDDRTWRGIDLLTIAPSTEYRFLVNARGLAAALKGADKHAGVTITANGEFVNVTIGDVAHVVDASAIDYPRTPLVDAQDVRSYWPGTFAGTFGTAAVCASTDESRPVLTGIYFDGANYCATDSYRMVVVTDPRTDTTFDSIIPSSAVRWIGARVAKAKSNPEIVLRRDTVYARFSIDGARVTVRNIEGQFPNFRSLKPEDAVLRPMPIGREVIARFLADTRTLTRNEPVRLTDRTISVHNGKGSAMSTHNPLATEIDAEIGFNAEFLADALLCVDGESLGVISPIRPAVLAGRTSSGAEAWYLVMPVRI